MSDDAIDVNTCPTCMHDNFRDSNNNNVFFTGIHDNTNRTFSQRDTKLKCVALAHCDHDNVYSVVPILASCAQVDSTSKTHDASSAQAPNIDINLDNDTIALALAVFPAAAPRVSIMVPIPLSSIHGRARLGERVTGSDTVGPL